MKYGCFRCHSGSPESRDPETLEKIKFEKKPPTSCPTCHTSDFALPIGHEGESWRTEHAPVAKKNFAACFECHDAGAKFGNGERAFCTLCHASSKVGAFKQTIGSSGASEEKTDQEASGSPAEAPAPAPAPEAAAAPPAETAPSAPAPEAAPAPAE